MGASTNLPYNSATSPAAVELDQHEYINNGKLNDPLDANSLPIHSLRTIRFDSQAATLIGANKQVFINVRTDGYDGSGAPWDPRDGSTQAKLEAIFVEHYDAESSDMTFYLGPGTFHLIGCAKSSWAMLPGWKVIGAGKDLTTVIQDLGGSISSYPLFTVFGTSGGNQEVSHLTIDLAHVREGATYPTSSFQAIALAGTGSKVSHVRVLNAGTEPEFVYENTIILIQGQAQTLVGVDDGVTIDDVAVEHCEIHCTGKTSAITIFNNASLDRVAETTVAVGSNGATLPQATIHVASTTGWPTSGTFFLGAREVTYTGKTSTTFTGCSGGTATLATGDVARMYYNNWGHNAVNSYNTVYGNGFEVIASVGCGGFDGGISTHNQFYDCGLNADTYPCANHVISNNYVRGREDGFCCFWSTRTTGTSFLYNTFVVAEGGTAFQFTGDPNGPTSGNTIVGNRCIDKGGAVRGLVVNDFYGSLIDNSIVNNIIDNTGWTNGVVDNAGVNTFYSENRSPDGVLMIPNTSNDITGTLTVNSLSNTPDTPIAFFMSENGTIGMQLSYSGISAVGSLTNIPLYLKPKGSENIYLGAMGMVKIDPSGWLYIDNDRVVKSRRTGWTAATGTATRTAFATSTVTLEELAQRVKALIDDLHSNAGHGLIGT